MKTHSWSGHERKGNLGHYQWKCKLHKLFGDQFGNVYQNYKVTHSFTQ